jgi:hypothetical protein
MNKPSTPGVFLHLPEGPSRSTLRAGLMALGIPPADLPQDRQARQQWLQSLAQRESQVAFVDISTSADRARPHLLELDALVPQGACRQRIFLTRLATGHVSPADRRWVQSLGFADLYPEFSNADSAGSLGQALQALGTPIAPAELARYMGALGKDANAPSPRTRLRQLTGLSAEALAQRLQGLLDIRDRTYRLKTYPQCFVASEAVHGIAQAFGCSPAQAVAIGRDLGALGLLEHVTHDHAFGDADLYFRLCVSDTVDRLPLGEIDAELRSPRGVAVADRSYLGRSYPQCWLGSEAVDWVSARYRLGRHDAWMVLQRLSQFGLLEHVVQEHDIKDRAYFYRFIAPAIVGTAKP